MQGTFGGAEASLCLRGRHSVICRADRSFIPPSTPSTRRASGDNDCQALPFHGTLRHVNEEPKLDAISNDDNEPATKRDVRNVVDELAGIVAEFSVSTENRFNDTEKRLETIESDLDTVKSELGTVIGDVTSLKKSTETILEIVNSIDSKVDNLPERVARLEKKKLGFVGK